MDQGYPTFSDRGPLKGKILVARATFYTSVWAVGHSINIFSNPLFENYESLHN